MKSENNSSRYDKFREFYSPELNFEKSYRFINALDIYSCDQNHN